MPGHTRIAALIVAAAGYAAYQWPSPTSASDADRRRFAKADPTGDGTTNDAQLPWPVPGVWHQPFLDRGCATRVADEPNVAISNWNYRACDAGLPGCELAIEDWTDVPGIRLPNHPIAIVQGKPMLEYARIYHKPNTTTDIALVDVVQELDGARRLAAGAAVPGDVRCLALTVPTTRGIAWWASRAGNGIEPTSFAGFSTWTAPKTVIALHAYANADFGLPDSGVRAIYASATSLFLSTASPESIVTITPHDGKAIARPPTPTAAEMLVEVPDGVIGVSADRYGIRRVGFDSVSQLIYRSPGIEVTNAVAYDQSTHTVVWRNVVVSGNAFTGGAIYAAPYVPNAPLAPKLVTEVPADFDYFVPSIVANAGYVVLARTSGQARVVRLSDGGGWDFALPANKVVVDILWVDDDHVWFWIGDTKQPTGILRQSRRGWGPPIAAPRY
jgi:hypothetical protein